MIGGLINKIINLFLPFLTRTAIIYYLGSLYLGLNSLYSSILNMLSLAELGFGAAMVFSMYEPIANGNDALVCALLNLYRKIYRIVGTFILVIGLTLLFFLPKLIKGEVPPDVNIYLLYIIFLLNTVLSYFLFAYQSSILIADQRSDIDSHILSITTSFCTFVQVLVLVLFKDYLLYCLVFPFFTIGKNFITNRIVRRKYPQYYCKGSVSAAKLDDIKKRVGGLFIYRICYVFRDTFGSIVISAFIGLTVLAKYNNYYYILSSVTGFLAIIKTSITAGVGNSIVTETQEKNYKDFNTCQLLYMWLSSWCTVALFCLYQPFIKLWIGAEYLFDPLTMALFCALFYCYKAGDICAVYRQAAGLWWEDRYRPIVEAILTVVLSIILVKTMGVSGVIIATIVCLVFINSIWASYVLFRHYFTEFKQTEYISRLLFFFIITSVAVAATGGICSLLTIEGLGGLCLRAVICVVFPNIILLPCFNLLPECKSGVSLMKRLLSKKI